MHQQIRIGIDARFWSREHGGFSSYTQGLLHALAKTDRQTTYRIFLRKADLATWDINQSNFQPVVADFVHYTISEQIALLKLLNAERLDLVHFLNFNHPLLYRGKFVTTLHDLTVLHQPTGRSQRSLLRRHAFVASLTHALRRAERVIAISEFSASDASRHLKISPARLEVIYEGGPERQELPFGNRAIIQEYLGTRDPYFLFVSQWRPHKGIRTLIDAFTRFKVQSGLPHRLVLAGRQSVSTEAVSELLKDCPFADDILRPGFVDDSLLPSLYRNAAAFVMPSEYEGFGLPVLEAMAYGAPLILANNSSLPEVGGSAALYFSTGDSEGLAARLTEALSNQLLIAQLQQNAETQLRRFTWENCAAQTLAVYLHVLEKRGISASL